jgi:3-oxoadipate enol-lactonase
VKLRYAVDGDPQAPALVLSNSLGTSLEMWDPQIDRLRERFYVIRYDTRGHGQSEVTAGPYAIAQLGADVTGLLDCLSIARAHFCGLSMGGITGMWLGLHQSARIDRLVLSNTAAYIGPPDSWTARAETVRRDGMAAIAPAVVSRWLTPDYAAANPDQVQALIAMLSATPADGYAANCIAVRDNDLRQEVDGIRARTLIIAGSGDIPTPPADAQYLLSQISRASYVEFEAAHLSNQQHPEAFADAVSRFLLAD